MIGPRPSTRTESLAGVNVGKNPGRMGHGSTQIDSRPRLQHPRSLPDRQPDARAGLAVANRWPDLGDLLRKLSRVG
jgi:hypothetical protein